MGDAVLSSGWLMPHLREKCGPAKMPPELWDRFAMEPMVVIRASKDSDPEKALLRCDILANDLYSPTLQDVEIQVDLAFKPLHLNYAPNLLNALFKAFRNTKTNDEKDPEAFQTKLEKELDAMTGAQNLKEMGEIAQLLVNRNMESDQAKKTAKTNCNMVKLVIIKLEMQLEAVKAVCLHQDTQLEFMELHFSQSSFIYDMYYDHDEIQGSFGNLQIFDLSNYPKTRIAHDEPTSRR